MLAGERARPDVAAARRRWRRHQGALEPHRLVFIDETRAKTNMARSWGQSRRGTRVLGRVPHGHWKTTTCLAGLRCDGITAPFVVDRPMNRLIFRTYVAEVLAPALAPGDIVVMDNLGSHKSDEVRRLIEAEGARLVFLPKYSPDLNPIEQVFAKLKASLRKAAERTVETVIERIGELLDDFSPQECANCLRNAGYASS